MLWIKRLIGIVVAIVSASSLAVLTRMLSKAGDTISDGKFAVLVAGIATFSVLIMCLIGYAMSGGFDDSPKKR